MTSNPVPQSVPTATEQSRFRRVFTGPNGIRTGWRLALFVALFFLLLLLVQGGLRLIPGLAAMAKQASQLGFTTPLLSLIFEAVPLAIALLSAGIMGRIEKRPFGAYGMPWAEAFGRRFWQGAVWGLSFECLECWGFMPSADSPLAP